MEEIAGDVSLSVLPFISRVYAPERSYFIFLFYYDSYTPGETIVDEAELRFVRAIEPNGLEDVSEANELLPPFDLTCECWIMIGLVSEFSFFIFPL